MNKDQEEDLDQSVEIVNDYNSDSEEEIEVQNRQTNQIGLQEVDEDQLYNLQMNIDEDMRKVSISIQDSISHSDWLIFEHHSYSIVAKLNNGKEYTVNRRFSDFEWLFQELILKYPGYILPALPEKGMYSRVDPKIPYFNKIKQEFMETRKQMLELFLIELLQHKELKFARELKTFLTYSDQQFQADKDRSSSVRQEKESSGQGLMRNIVNIGKGVFGMAGGQGSSDKRKLDKTDEEFEQIQNYYSASQHKLKEICECLHKIFESRKKQAENLQGISDIFEEIKETANVQVNLKKISLKAGLKQADQVDRLQRIIYIPLKQQAEQYKNCLDMLENRKKLADFVHQQGIDIKHLKQDSERQVKLMQKENNEALSLNLKLKEDQKKLINFSTNFKYNEDYFRQSSNNKIKFLISEFSRLEKEDSSKLLAIWAGSGN